MRISDWSSDVCSSDLTVDARLIALDAVTGARCPGFGRNGQVSLLEGKGDVEKGYYFVTSPPALVRGKLVLGGWVTDGQHVGEPSGVVRAYDAVTGAFSWAFDAGRPDFHGMRSEEHTSELQSLMRISYAVFCLKKKTELKTNINISQYIHTSHTN